THRKSEFEKFKEATSSIAQNVLSLKPAGDVIMPDGSIVYRGESGGGTAVGNWYQADKINAAAYAKRDGKQGIVVAVDISGKRLTSVSRYLDDHGELDKKGVITDLLDRAKAEGYDGLYSTSTGAFILPSRSAESFINGLNPMQKGRVISTLNVKSRYDGEVKTLKEHIEQLISEGRKAEKKEFIDKKALTDAKEEKDRIHFNGDQNIKASRLKELDDIIANPPKKISYRITSADGSFYEVNKTGYDYARYLEGDHIADASKKVETEAVEEDTAFKRDADLYTLKALEDRLKSINAQIGKEDNSETRGHRPSDHDKKTARIAKLNERRDIVSQRIRDAKAGKLVAPEPKPIRPAKPTPQERIDALVKKDQEYYDSAPSKGFIESNFSFENLSNKTKLARYLDGTENEYNGLVGWKWQSVLEKMGLPESIKWGETTRKEVAAFVKQQYEQAKPAEQQPEAKPDNNRPLFVVDAQHDIAKVTKWNGDKPTVIYAGTRGGIEAQTNKKYEYEIENYKEATSKDFDRAIRPGGSQTMIELRMWKDQFIKHTIENSEMGKRGAEQYKGWGKPAAKEPWQMTREEFLDAEELAKEERSQYVSPEGKVIASSRTTPAKQSQLEVGTWRRESTSWNKYGDTIEQLQEIDVSKINGSEDTGRDKADDVD
ncbi:MAG: hypothetical protein ABFD45_09540, partial [Smithella sp.]